MENGKRLRFQKSDRICSLIRISEIFSTGSVVYHHPFKIFYLNSNSSKSKVLISVPKRLFKRAVVRNHIKRKIRESLRVLQFQTFSERGVDMCIIYTDKTQPGESGLNDKIKDVLEKIRKRVEICSLPTTDSID